MLRAKSGSYHKEARELVVCGFWLGVHRTHSVIWPCRRRLWPRDPCDFKAISVRVLRCAIGEITSKMPHY